MFKLIDNTHMAKPDIRIELGRTDGFRYIGVQPPLTPEQFEAIQAAEVDVNLGFYARKPFRGQPYTEAGIMTDLGQGNEHAVAMAHRTAEALRGLGHTVAVAEEFQGIGYGYHLFGGQDRILA